MADDPFFKIGRAKGEIEIDALIVKQIQELTAKLPRYRFRRGDRVVVRDERGFEILIRMLVTFVMKPTIKGESFGRKYWELVEQSNGTENLYERVPSGLKLVGERVRVEKDADFEPYPRGTARRNDAG